MNPWVIAALTIFVFLSGYLARGAIDSLRRNAQAQKRNTQELLDALARLEDTGGFRETDF